MACTESLNHSLSESVSQSVRERMTYRDATHLKTPSNKNKDIVSQTNFMTVVQISVWPRRLSGLDKPDKRVSFG